ncbi:MAG: invasion associated locus B family protein [Gammaproteobacteria bacterium]|nr:invasion associated locus B family protein [Gammaproteobacteria bacterium]
MTTAGLKSLARERGARHRTSIAAVLFTLTVAVCTAPRALARAPQIFRGLDTALRGAGEFAGRCYIRQTLTLKDSGRMLFEIAAGYPLGGEYPLLLMTIPLGSFLPPGITIGVDDAGQWRATVAYCNSDGCHAYYRMTPELYRMFRQGRWLNVSYQDGSRRDNRFQASLNGFSAAIDSIDRAP